MSLPVALAFDDQATHRTLKWLSSLLWGTWEKVERLFRYNQWTRKLLMPKTKTTVHSILLVSPYHYLLASEMELLSKHLITPTNTKGAQTEGCFNEPIIVVGSILYAH